MLKVALASINSKQEYCTGKSCVGPILITQTLPTFEGVFKAATRSSGGTSIVAEPLPRSSILLTDMILTADRVAASTVIVRFTDDTNAINIITANCNDAPINLALTFGGRWQGWKNAKIELVTIGNVTTTVALGYMKIEEKYTLAYDEWNAER